MASGAPVMFWGEIPLAATDDTRYVRARGVEASLSTVGFVADAALDLVPPADAQRFAQLGAGAKGVAVAKAIQLVIDSRVGGGVLEFSKDQRVSYRGDLVLAHETETDERPDWSTEPQVSALKAKSLFLVEARVATPETTPPIVRATLADVRYFWDDFGEITRSWNVPLPPAADGSPRWEQATAKERGTKPTPLREILQTLLEALPGRLPIVRFPADYASIFPPFQVRCWAASPKEVLGAILVHTGLDLDIGPDLRARFFAPGEGEVGETDPQSPGEDNTEAHDPVAKAGAWQEAVTGAGDRYARRRAVEAPSEVLVVGGRTEWTISVDFMTPSLVREVVIDLDGTNERQVIEVTPPNLAKLCRGELDPKIDTSDQAAGVVADETQTPAPVALDPGGVMAGRADLSIPVARALEAVKAGPPALPSSTPAPPVPVAGSAGSVLDLPGAQIDLQFSLPVSMAYLDDPLFWERLVLQPKPWTALLPGVSPVVVRLLEQQLMRVYQVPAEFRRCLPILRRAERDKSGKRRAPMLEGFRFTSYEVQVPPVAKVPIDRQKLQAYADELRGQLAITLAHLEKVRGLRLAEVTKATADAAKAALEGREKDAGKAAQAVGQAVESKAKNALGSLFGVAEFDAEIEITGQAAEAFRARIRSADDLLNPVSPLLREMDALLKEIASFRTQGLSAPLRLQDQQRVLQEKIRAKQAELASAATIEEERPRFVTEHVNLPLRTSFPFRVLDADEGLVEVLGDELPGWVSETIGALDMSKALLVLPVRLTFGTTNERDVLPIATGGGADHSYYVSRALALVRANPELSAILGDFGNVHPATRELTGLPLGNHLPAGPAAPGQVRFTFTRSDQTTGQAEVGPHPWRVVEDVKLLVGLDGSSNREEVFQRCAAAARPLLRRPEVGETGELELVLPRTVICNGRISATEVRYRPEFLTFTTTVSFASDLQPLLGVFGDVRDRGAFSGTFGLGVDAKRGD